MKIAFIYDAIYPWVKGGAEKRIYELGKRLAEEGNDVHLFGVKWWDGEDIIRKDGMVMHGVCRKMELYVNGRRSLREAIIYSIKLFPHLARYNFDVIDVSAFPYFPCFTVKIISISKKIPVVTTWHEVWGNYWYEYLGIAGFFGRLIEHLVLRISNNAIAVSDSTKKSLESSGCGNVHVVTNGIDIKRITEIRPSADASDIIFIGRFIKEKNIDILIGSIDHIRKNLSDIKCNIVGQGPEEKKLIDMVSDLNLKDNVKFFKSLDYDTLISMIKSSKVLVLPSIREGFGVVVLEAFACGVPVITVKSPHNAAYELVSEDTGLVVDLNIKELGDSIQKVVIDDEFRKKTSVSAIKKASEYDWNKKTRELLNIYNGLISE